MASSRLWMFLAGIAVVSSVARGQLISCTPSMIAAFTPCINFITGSSTGGGGRGFTPSEECCKAAGKLAAEGSDCACSLVRGAVPFGLPINRSLALTLPFACGEPSQPLFQCKSTLANNGTVPLPPLGSPPPITSPPPPRVIQAPSRAEDWPFTTASAAIKGLDMVTLPPMLLMVLTLL